MRIERGKYSKSYGASNPNALKGHGGQNVALDV